MEGLRPSLAIPASLKDDLDLDDLMKLRALSQIAKYCWLDDPTGRPNFTEISVMLSNLLGETANAYAYELSATGLEKMNSDDDSDEEDAILRSVSATSDGGKSWKEITRRTSMTGSIGGRGLIDHSLAVVEE